MPEPSANLSQLRNRAEQKAQALKPEESDPLWHANPQVHGDLMARILGMHALFCRSSQEACTFAQRAFDAAYHPDVKEATQALIASFARTD